MQHEKVETGKKLNTIPNVIKEELERLVYRKKMVSIFWNICSILIALCNVSIVVLSIYVLSKLVSIGETSFSKIGPAILISLFTIFIFSLSLVLAIFENLKKDKIYSDAINLIQHKIIKFQTKQAPFNKEKQAENKIILKEIVQADLERVLSIKKKIDKRAIIIKALVGDPND